jgi:tetratricopeptide (TPR) repeat protein
VLEELGEEERAVAAYERALELAPGDGYLLERLEALGALRRLRSPDGQEYWLTPPDFERVVRAELAALNQQQPEQLVARGIALAADGHADLARAAGELALRHDPDDLAAQDLARLGRGSGRRGTGYTGSQ